MGPLNQSPPVASDLVDAEFTATRKDETMNSNWFTALLLAAAIPLSASAADVKHSTAQVKNKTAVVAQANTKGAKHAKRGKKAKTPKADTKQTPKS